MRRLTAWLARFAASLLLRRLEVAGEHRYPKGRPVLLVANHFNGLVDPVVITAALGRSPRFIAKASLRRVPLGGWVLRRLVISRQTCIIRSNGGTGRTLGAARWEISAATFLIQYSQRWS